MIWMESPVPNLMREKRKLKVIIKEPKEVLPEQRELLDSQFMDWTVEEVKIPINNWTLDEKKAFIDEALDADRNGTLTFYIFVSYDSYLYSNLNFYSNRGALTRKIKEYTPGINIRVGTFRYRDHGDLMSGWNKFLKWVGAFRYRDHGVITNLYGGQVLSVISPRDWKMPVEVFGMSHGYLAKGFPLPEKYYRALDSLGTVYIVDFNDYKKKNKIIPALVVCDSININLINLSNYKRNWRLLENVKVVSGHELYSSPFCKLYGWNLQASSIEKLDEKLAKKMIIKENDYF